MGVLAPRYALSCILLFGGSAHGACIGHLQLRGVDAFGGEVSLLGRANVVAMSVSDVSFRYAENPTTLPCGIYRIRAIVPGFTPSTQAVVEVKDGKRTLRVVNLALEFKAASLATPRRILDLEPESGCGILWVRAIPMHSDDSPLEFEVQEGIRVTLDGLRDGLYTIYVKYDSNCSKYSGAAIMAAVSLKLNIISSSKIPR